MEALAVGDRAAAHLFLGNLDEAEHDWAHHAELDTADFPLGSAALAAAYANRITEAQAYIADARRRNTGTISGSAWLDYCEAEVGNSHGVEDIDLLERAIEKARSVEAPFIVGVAMVTLSSIHASRGDVPRSAELYEELLRHWLRSGSWTQQWTTLRHVAALLEASHPQEALDIMLAVETDPLRPSVLVGEAAAAANALRQRLVERVPDADRRPCPPRLEVVEHARAALLELAARTPTT